MNFYINRRLKIGEEYFSETEALSRGKVLVVLAEPGAGKTDLLAKFGRMWNVERISANIFRGKTQLQENQPWIIDALDEVAKIDQSAVDLIIVRAQEVSNGHVIFSSRSSEWQEARTKAIQDCFGVKPIIIRIEPFNPDEQRQLFEAHVPDEDFAAFIREAERFELTPLLGNPQFLKMFADAYIQSGRQFTSKKQIFWDAAKRLALEKNDAIIHKPLPPVSEIIAIASDVMAKLLLSGASGVSAQENLRDTDYPYLSAMASSNPEGAFLTLDTKLFKPASDPNQHEPVHRIVAEYCAAQYIVHRIDNSQNPFSLKRVLAVIAPNGAVRDELRGLLGWMACLGSERIQRAAIELDAYAVLANGAPSQLTVASKRFLLHRLELVAASNPGFRRSDDWRNFSVSGFFTHDMTDEIRRILQSNSVSSPLVDLLMKLVADAGAPEAILGDLRDVMFNGAAPQYTRLWASRAICKISGSVSSGDLDELIRESTANALRIAAEVIAQANANTFSDDIIGALLRAFTNLYPPGRNRRNDTSIMASYYLKHVITQLDAEKTANHLDHLTAGLSCTCQRPDYDCQCRKGISKVVGLLLDHYFETSVQPYEPNRIWQWVRSLWYERYGNAEENASIRLLKSNHELRHQMHRLAFEGVTDFRQAQDIRLKLFSSYRHAGISIYEGDALRMADFAFETDNPDLWAAFWAQPINRREHRGPDALRQRLREHAAAKPAFMMKWAKPERSYRENRDEQLRRGERMQRRWEMDDARTRADTRARLEENRQQIENGNHWGWVDTFASLYFSRPDELSRYTDDITLVENALRNCLPLLQSHIPTLQQLAENEGWSVANAAFVSCWIQFRDRGNLDHVDTAILTAAKIEAGNYQSMSDEDYHAFEQELDRLLFQGGDDAEEFARGYIEPGLSGARDASSKVWFLASKKALSHLRASLSIEWLRTYPAIPISARYELFNIAAMSADQTDLLNLINQRVSETAVLPANETSEDGHDRMDDLQFWQVRKFFFETSDADGWDYLRLYPDIIFEIDGPAGRFERPEGWPNLSAAKIFKILDTFVDVWPHVHLPNSWGTGDPPEERAYRFLKDIVWRIGNDNPERSLPVIERLMADSRFSGFNTALLTLQAETIQKARLSGFTAPAPYEIASMFAASGIASVEDLRAFVVEELEWLQNELQNGETNPLAAYYDNSKHVYENTARNRVVERLQSRMTAMNMPVVIEHHMADSNRCDFTVSAMIQGQRLLLVVEAKGQWHTDLYSAASAQLNERYASHPDAARQGIYLVFWFGSDTEVADRVRHGISTAEQLREEIISKMPKELDGMIDIVVLDLSR